MISVNLTSVHLEKWSGVLLVSLKLCDGKDASVRAINFDMNKEMHPIFGNIFLMQEQCPSFFACWEPIHSFKAFLYSYWLTDLNNIHRRYSFSYCGIHLDAYVPHVLDSEQLGQYPHPHPHCLLR